MASLGQMVYRREVPNRAGPKLKASSNSIKRPKTITSKFIIILSYANHVSFLATFLKLTSSPPHFSKYKVYTDYDNRVQCLPTCLLHTFCIHTWFSFMIFNITFIELLTMYVREKGTHARKENVIIYAF